MPSIWITPNNNPYPHTLIIGILLAVACGVLGGLLWVYFRDIAGGDSQPVRRPDDFRLSSWHDTKPRNNHSLGGCAVFVFCLVLGSTAILFMGNAMQFRNFLQGMRDIDASYYYPDRNQQNVAVTHEPIVVHYTIPKPSYADWTDNHWTADDAPFLKIRHEVDAGITNGKITRYYDPDMYSEQERIIHHWTDIPGTFRGAYIGSKLAYHKWYHFNASKRFSHYMRKDNTGLHPDRQYEIRKSIVAENIYGAAIVMKTFKNPHSYQYSRLMFLLDSLGMLTRSYKKAVPDKLIIEGKNLAAHRPDDWEVKLMLARMLDTFDDTNHQKQALDYAQEVVEAKPKWSQAWETLGIAYNSLASENGINKTEQKKNLAAALAAYQNCARIAPIDYGPKFDVEEAIQKIIAKKKLLAE
jgi:hypothetical protein